MSQLTTIQDIRRRLEALENRPTTERVFAQVTAIKEVDVGSDAFTNTISLVCDLVLVDAELQPIGLTLTEVQVKNVGYQIRPDAIALQDGGSPQTTGGSGLSGRTEAASQHEHDFSIAPHTHTTCSDGTLAGPAAWFGLSADVIQEHYWAVLGSVTTGTSSIYIIDGFVPKSTTLASSVNTTFTEEVIIDETDVVEITPENVVVSNFSAVYEQSSLHVLQGKSGTFTFVRDDSRLLAFSADIFIPGDEALNLSIFKHDSTGLIRVFEGELGTSFLLTLDLVGYPTFPPSRDILEEGETYTFILTKREQDDE